MPIIKKKHLNKQIFEISAILDKRIISRSKRVEYLVQWKGYTDATWEPAGNLYCKEMIDKFEQGQNSQNGSTSNANESSTEDNDRCEGIKTERSLDRIQTFSSTELCSEIMGRKLREQGINLDKEDPLDQEFELERISGSFMSHEKELTFIVHWKNIEGFIYISSDHLRKYNPQFLIDYYESIISFI